MGLTACGASYGNKLESDELDIFYTKIENEDFARNIAKYWKEHDFLGAKKQYLQLAEENEVLLLKIIPTEKFNSESFTFDERAKLKELQDSLQPLVRPKRLELVIAKRNFEPIYNIN
jgi:hypothetical protein